MRKRLISLLVTVCMVCLMTMTSCSAANIPQTSNETEKAPTAAFTDVPANAWYAEAIAYVQEHGIMNGYGNGKFGPEDTLTRAQFAQIFYNMAGQPAVSGSISFQRCS